MAENKKSRAPRSSGPRKPRPPQPGLEPRRAALALVQAVRRDGRLLAELTDTEEGPLAVLSPPERARAQRLAAQALRHAQRIDKALSPFLEKAPPARVRMVLHLAVVELCEDRSAAHGVVNGWVTLVRAHPKTRHLAGLVNAVLRRASEELAPGWDSLPPSRLPDWLRKPFRKAYGGEAVAAMEAVFAAQPPLDLTPKDGDAAALAGALGGTALPTGSVRLAEAGQVSALPGYAEGQWWVQDAAAAVPARVLAPAKGARVLDLCAAPGGKTQQMAAAGAEVTALDISPARMARVAENLARTGLAAQTVVADAMDWAPEMPFDGILLDAPCTATGTLRRHPDLPFAKTAAATAELAALQAAMLDRALGWLAPGGRLVFCTCSLLPEEGEAQIAAALARHPGLVADPLDPAEFGLPAAAAVPGGLRLRPDFLKDQGGMDGFFIARLHLAPL
ncbi:RsmB/NOP family class I SAM-dependent RNA methyltransferase [Poseidonocella sp. HB161398]|uniref:RsmB/NOP family class I SAM-dependent RNA methyltransferase n=1 Tax=Poseidonocella sp. HB161398 TaxID=2320855 RepID=UPI001109B84F|nr:transcription antitermination factor NusB [Poseidonocella sp. HB161398]